MRIAYVGNFQPPWSTENDIKSALESMGHEVVPLQENLCRDSEIRRQALTSDLLLWTSTWDDAHDLAETAATVDECKGRGIPTAAVHLDVFHGTGRGGRNWQANPMWLMEKVYTASGDHQEEWAAMGVDHTWLPPAVRHSACYFGAPLIDYRCDVAFVGASGADGSYHPDVWPYRALLVDELRAMCARNRWSFRCPGGESDEPNWGKIDRGDDMNRFLATAKVTVGDSLCLAHEASLYCSDRAFETPGRGGLLIMPEIDFLNWPQFYDGALPTYPWGDFHALEWKIDELLHKPKDRLDIRQRTQRIVADGHTYVNRMDFVLRDLELIA